MRDAATLEMVRLLLSVEPSNRETLSRLVLNIDPEDAKVLCSLINSNKDTLSLLTEILRFRSNVSNQQCAQAVNVVCPEVITQELQSSTIDEELFEPIRQIEKNKFNNRVSIGVDALANPQKATANYTAQLLIENLQANLEGEIENPSDLKKEYYYLSDGKKRSFVLGVKLFEALSKVCRTGNHSKRLFLDALGQKVERLAYPASSKMKSKTLRREVLNFIVAIEGVSTPDDQMRNTSPKLTQSSYTLSD